MSLIQLRIWSGIWVTFVESETRIIRYMYIGFVRSHKISSMIWKCPLQHPTLARQIDRHTLPSRRTSISRSDSSKEDCYVYGVHFPVHTGGHRELPRTSVLMELPNYAITLKRANTGLRTDQQPRYTLRAGFKHWCPRCWSFNYWMS